MHRQRSNVLPDLISNTLEVVKLTSLASVVALPELLYAERLVDRVLQRPRPQPGPRRREVENGSVLTDRESEGNIAREILPPAIHDTAGKGVEESQGAKGECADQGS